MAASKKQQEADQELALRGDQLRAAELKLQNVEANLHTVRSYEALSSHLEGFYLEIDKLAKGRALIEATDLVVAQANDIIRDAKEIIKGDVYLDRIKEFVPAGTNPVYPDVLLVAQSVNKALDRFGEQQEDGTKALTSRRTELLVTVRALKLFLEEGDHLSKDQIADLGDGEIDEDWFFESDDGKEYFNFDRIGVGSGARS